MRPFTISRFLALILLILTVPFYYACESGGPEFGMSTGSFRSSNPLTEDDVKLIISQAVTEAVNIGIPVTVSVVDRGGTVLGVFRMDGAPISTVIGSQNPDNIIPIFPDK